MNIDDLTLKQIKEIQALGCLNAESKSKSISQNAIGKHVICRTRNEGINFGLVEDADETGVVLSGARRIHYHKPKDNSVSWYEGVAQTGLSSDSKISCPTNKTIVEDYSLTICTEAAKESLINAKSHEQN